MKKKDIGLFLGKHGRHRYLAPEPWGKLWFRTKPISDAGRPNLWRRILRALSLFIAAMYLLFAR